MAIFISILLAIFSRLRNTAVDVIAFLFAGVAEFPIAPRAVLIAVTLGFGLAFIPCSVSSCRPRLLPRVFPIVPRDPDAEVKRPILDKLRPFREEELSESEIE